MSHPAANTAEKKGRAAYATRGLILLVVLAGTLASIYILARLAPPKVRPEDMIVTPSATSEDTRDHGLTMSEEQAGKTGRDASAGMEGMYAAPAAPGTAAGSPGGAPAAVEHPAKHYNDLPGIDLSLLPPKVFEDILAKANHEECVCDCGMTIAQCRNEDPNCRHSLQRVAAIYADLVGSAIERGEITEH
jgi:hypothetical protein